MFAEWNESASKGRCDMDHSEYGINRIMHNGRNIFVRITKNGINNVLEPLPVWEKKLSVNLRKRGATILSQAIRGMNLYQSA